ncbi:MAG: polysaccharide deacetylase family protein, partial [Pseudomonadota bacterium]
MSRRNTPLVKAALTALHAIRADRVFDAASDNCGVIFMLHHVVPEMPKGFAPNRILKITPEFLELAIDEARAAGLDFVSMDEAGRRLRQPEGARPFACFTFDDGYRDNFTYAYPVLKRHNVPFTIYVTPAFADGDGDFWWLTLEEVIARATRISVPLPSGERAFDTR